MVLNSFLNLQQTLDTARFVFADQWRICSYKIRLNLPIQDGFPGRFGSEKLGADRHTGVFSIRLESQFSAGGARLESASFRSRRLASVKSTVLFAQDCNLMTSSSLSSHSLDILLMGASDYCSIDDVSDCFSLDLYEGRTLVGV